MGTEEISVEDDDSSFPFSVSTLKEALGWLGDNFPHQPDLESATLRDILTCSLPMFFCDCLHIVCLDLIITSPSAESGKGTVSFIRQLLSTGFSQLKYS